MFYCQIQLFVFCLLIVKLCIASTNLNQNHRLRRQSPFLESVHSAKDKYTQRRTLSTQAHRKVEQ